MEKLGSLLSGLIDQKSKDPTSVIVPPTSISDIGDSYTHLDEFHLKELYMVCRDDDYFCGIRANHFSVEVGINEITNERQVLVVANHKGVRRVTLLKL